MRFQAHLSDVEQVLIRCLEGANDCLKIYLSSFANRYLFDAIVSRQRHGVQVSFALLDAPGNRQTSIAWERLSANGGTIFWLTEQTTVDFCPSQDFLLIDNKRVVSGRFNLGSLISAEVPASFLEYSDPLAANYFESIFDLLIGKNEINDPRAKSTFGLVENPKIQLQRSQALVLQSRILAVESDIAEIKRQIHQFEHQKEKSIGSLIRRYLAVKRSYSYQVYENDRQANSKIEAEEDEQTYQQYSESSLEMSNDVKPSDLNAEQLEELKQLYRKLAMQCHPDRVGEAHKENAQAFFQQLQFDYKKNDLTGLKYLKLQIDLKLSSRASHVFDDSSAKLAQTLSDLQSRIATLAQEEFSLKNSSSWSELNAHKDWEELFARYAEQLERQIQRYSIDLDLARHMC